MSKFDEAWKDYFKDSSRFADIVNMFCYQGEQVVDPKDVKETKSGGGRFLRDTVRKVVCGHNIMICGIESQETIDYSLAARIMGYDHMEYEKQIKSIKKRNKDTFAAENKPIEPGELLYKFLKTDRLEPVGTIVIYSGGKWTGPKSLWELCGIDKKLGKRMRIVNDYPLHIIELTELTEDKLKQFRTDVRQVFSLLKNIGKRDKIKEVIETAEGNFRLQEDAGRLIELYCGKKFRTKKEEVKPMPSIRENFERIMQNERADMREEMKDEVRNEVKEEVKEEVREEVRQEFRQEGIKGMVQDNIDENVPEDRIVSKLMKYFKLSREDADKYVKMYAA